MYKQLIIYIAMLELYFLFIDEYDLIYKFGESDMIVTHTVILSRRFVISHFGRLFVGGVYSTPNENIWTR